MALKERLSTSYNMFTILGSGFGMYGYLPALILYAKQNVILPEKYLAILQSRADISDFVDDIIWVKTSKEALSRCNSLVLALPPKIQQQFFFNQPQISNIKKIILEKPLACDPVAATQLLEKLIGDDKRIRIGFSLMHTFWYRDLANFLVGKNKYKLKIDWQFQANHFVKNIETWKRYHSQGGGAMRFYGIHLIAIFAALNFDEVELSELLFKNEDQAYCWKGIVKNNNICEFVVDSKSYKNQFTISVILDGETKVIVDMADPFDSVEPFEIIDRRVSILAKVVESFKENDSVYNEFYQKTCRNWQNIENKTLFIKT